MTEEFNEYMENFKKLDIKEKQKIIIDELKYLSAFTNKMCDELGVNNEVIVHKELLDLNSENYSQDDYAEAIIVYINSIKNALCDFSDGLSDINNSLE
mgnify:CR=1 FL=1